MFTLNATWTFTPLTQSPLSPLLAILCHVYCENQFSLYVSALFFQLLMTLQKIVTLAFSMLSVVFRCAHCIAKYRNKEDPRYEPFFKLLDMGMPPMIVENKMERVGFDPAILLYISIILLLPLYSFTLSSPFFFRDVLFSVIIGHPPHSALLFSFIVILSHFW